MSGAEKKSGWGLSLLERSGAVSGGAERGTGVTEIGWNDKRIEIVPLTLRSRSAHAPLTCSDRRLSPGQGDGDSIVVVVIILRMNLCKS